MQLLRPTEVPITSDAVVFRYSRFRAALLGLLIFGTGVTCLAWGRQRSVGMERYLLSYIGATILLLLFFLRGYIIARFRGSNWLAQAVHGGVFIQFRSYLNYALPDSDQTVVFIVYDEIISAGTLTESIASTDPQGQRTTRAIRYIHLHLRGDMTEVAEAVAAERTRSAVSQKRWYGTPKQAINTFQCE